MLPEECQHKQTKKTANKFIQAHTGNCTKNLVQAHKDRCTANIVLQAHRDKGTSCPHKLTQGQANMCTSHNEQDTLTLPPAGLWDTSIWHIYTIICTIYCSCHSRSVTILYWFNYDHHPGHTHFTTILHINTRSQHNIHVCIGHKHINQPHTHRGSGFTCPGNCIHACLHSHALLRSF